MSQSPKETEIFIGKHRKQTSGLINIVLNQLQETIVFSEVSDLLLPYSIIFQAPRGHVLAPLIAYIMNILDI